MFKSLKYKIITLNFILILVVILFLGSICYWLLYHYLLQAQKERLAHIVNHVSERIECYLFEKQNTMKVIINNRIIDEYFLKEDPEILKDYFNRLRHEFPAISIVDFKGEEKVRVVKGRLSERKNIFGDKPYFKEALSKPECLVISPYIELPIDLDKVATIRLIITRTSYFAEKFIVGLITELPLSNIHKVVQQIIKDEKISLIIIDKEGNIVDHPYPDNILTKLTGEGKPFEELLVNATSLKSGFTRASIMGRDSIISYSPLEKLSWSVLGILSYADFMVVPNMLKKIVGIIFLFVFIIASFALTGLAEYISSPLRKITNLTAEIAKGDFSKQIEFKSQDEIGRLANSFNLMIQSLQKTLVSRDELVKEIEERKAIEEELLTSLEQLQQTQEQLIQTAKMASLGQLAAGLAHEINNPLTGVLNNVQLLKMELQAKPEGISTSELKEVLDVVEEAALRCKKITQSLLDFSRASRKELEPLSVNEIIERVVNLVSHELRLQNIIIQTELNPELPLVNGNAQLLQQVVMNMITNAQWAIRKKSAEKGGSITIKTEYIPETKKVNLYICDTGIGMSDEVRQRIFEPFFTTKEVGEGSGLGMSIAYRIIQDHKGTIEVESKLGQGTTFKISLPVISP